MKNVEYDYENLFIYLKIYHFAKCETIDSVLMIAPSLLLVIIL